MFEAYHETDQALRGEILGRMNAGESGGGLTVIQGHDFSATGKIANLRALPLCPGPAPFVPLLGLNEDRQRNAQVLARLFNDHSWSDNVVGSLRGQLCDQQFSMLQIAEILESLFFSEHIPSPQGENHRRWQAFERQGELQDSLFRAPDTNEPRDFVQPQSCPYSIAAYLRLWLAAAKNPFRGVYPTDMPSTPWSMVGGGKHATGIPKFNVGVRYGSAGDSSHPELRQYGVKRMIRQIDRGRIVSTWGASPGATDAYFGDRFFDLHCAGLSLPPADSNGTRWRPRGYPGLLLFHVVEHEGNDVVTVGLGIPLGGPDHFAALPARHA